MIRVRAKTPIRYKGQRFEIGEILDIDEKDMNIKIFEQIEVIEGGSIAEYTDEFLDEVGKTFIKDIEEAYELAIIENNTRSLEELKVEELKELAKEKEIEGYSKMKKEELIAALAGE